jgi:hypothetical protein
MEFHIPCHVCHRLYAHRQNLAASANALTLGKCLRQKMWSDSRQQCRQLSSVNRSVAKAFADKGVTTLTGLLATDPRKLESFSQRKYPFGAILKPCPLCKEGWGLVASPDWVPICNKSFGALAKLYRLYTPYQTPLRKKGMWADSRPRRLESFSQGK